MGSWLSHLWWGGDPDQPDAVSGLSQRDLHLLRKSWRPLYRRRVASGTEILDRLFRADPETRLQFAMLRGVGEAEARSLPQFEAHVINLMSALDAVFSALDRPPLAIAILQKVGDSHRRRRIPAAQFHTLRAVILKLLADLGCDQDTRQAWARALVFMYDTILPRPEHTPPVT